MPVVDKLLGETTTSGTFWHRYTFDGNGETRSGAPWAVSKPNTFQTIGRLWPVLAGEHGEYELSIGDLSDARAELSAIAMAHNDGYLLPEQVWGNESPGGKLGFPSGKGTLSATPLAWSHAQFIRLAWDIAAGHLLEQPSVVACRYVGCEYTPHS